MPCRCNMLVWKKTAFFPKKLWSPLNSCFCYFTFKTSSYWKGQLLRERSINVGNYFSVLKSYKASLQKQWLRINLIQCGVYFLSNSCQNTTGLQTLLFIPLRINTRKFLYFFGIQKNCGNVTITSILKFRCYVGTSVHTYKVQQNDAFPSTLVKYRNISWTAVFNSVDVAWESELFSQQVPGTEDVFTKPINGTNVKRIIWDALSSSVMTWH